jgi:hypothetical protein
MFLFLAFAGQLAGAAGDSIAPRAVGPLDRPVGVSLYEAADTTPRKPRKKAVVLSDAYEIRLTVHKYASYATLPIFAAQAIIGQQLYNNDSKGLPRQHGLVGAHDAVAVALGGLFAVNTFTGGLNWWETRNQAEGRTWRTIHSVLMLASDAGFAYTAATGKRARGLQADRDWHKSWAIASASVALVSYVMMLGPIRGDK